jgi:predicted NBD/HSP70 family sugar kinase
LKGEILPVYVENGRNLAAVGEWGFGTGHGKGCLVSLSIGPGAGAGIVIDRKLYRGRSHSAGEVAWYLDDPHLTGHAFAHLVDKQALRFGPGITEDAIAALENAKRRYVAGELSLDAFFGSVTADRSLGVVRELLDYSTMAAASISALINPQTIIIAGSIVRGAPLAIDVLRKRLNGNVYDPPRIMLSELGHRDVVMGAIMMVLDATTLNPTDPVR